MRVVFHSGCKWIPSPPVHQQMLFQSTVLAVKSRCLKWVADSVHCGHTLYDNRDSEVDSSDNGNYCGNDNDIEMIYYFCGFLFCCWYFLCIMVMCRRQWCRHLKWQGNITNANDNPQQQPQLWQWLQPFLTLLCFDLLFVFKVCFLVMRAFFVLFSVEGCRQEA